MESNWGAHSTFPSFPVSLPSGKGEAGSYPHPALKLGKLNLRSSLVSIARQRTNAQAIAKYMCPRMSGLRALTFRLEQNIVGWFDGLPFAEGPSARRARFGPRVGVKA
jgi:hypothetical protein